MMEMATELAPQIGVAGACRAVNLPRATYYRNLPSDTSQKPSSNDENRVEEQAVAQSPTAAERTVRRSPRALDGIEEKRVLDELHSERFMDKSPGEVYATLLDEGTYICSERTMYRILNKHGEVKERRNQCKHPNYKKPELLATKPNQVWSWDITKLKGPVKWTYFYLYVILDIFSRYVVGWMVAPKESAELAKQLIGESYVKQGVEPGELTIHSDRGSPMKAKSTALLMANLGISKSHSRPHVSDDNPFSESQFKTLKYCPKFPARFGSVMDSRAFCVPFFDWYNREHRHSGIGMMTPEMVHYGLAEQVWAERQRVLEAAYAAHPQRFVRGRPTPPTLPEAVWINPPVVNPVELPRAENNGSQLADAVSNQVLDSAGEEVVA